MLPASVAVAARPRHATPRDEETKMAYDLKGSLLEVCDCNVLCPCWVGEDPDNDACEAIVAWHIDRGEIDGLDVSGLTLAAFAHIPDNVLVPESWRVALFVDDRASERQQQALLDVWSGKHGGPVGQLMQVVGEVASVERAPIDFIVEEGQGTLRIGDAAYAEMAPFRGATGATTTLAETVFSTIPGAPAYASKASRYERTGRPYGMADIALEGHNAVQGEFTFRS
jgi:hypothetical protein